MGFFLFLLVTATLFVRPAEIITDLEKLPIYNWLILACLAASLPGVLAQFSRQSLTRQPITVGVLGLLAAVFLSHASHGDLWSARFDAMEFSKSVIFYLLLVANVNSAARLRTFLFWLLGCIGVVAGLGVLQYHGVIDIASLTVLNDSFIDEVTGRQEDVLRMRSTGIFNDPNDLAMILVLGMALTAYFLFDPRLVQLKVILFAAIAMFFYSLVLTKSRGGFLALLAALGALFQARFGWKKALVLGGLCLPLVAMLVGGRQADIGGAVSGGTGQSRIQLWSSGMQMVKQFPLFGLGHGRYAEQAVQVAHNSYVHAFGELGLFGGALFLGAFYYAVRTLYRLGQGGRVFANLELGRLRPYMLSAVAGFSASMISLSRTDVAPTYLLLGLPAVYLGQARVSPPLAGTAMSWKLVKEIMKVSVLFLAATYIFIRVFARWSG
jgi:O-antigen ligase